MKIAARVTPGCSIAFLLANPPLSPINSSSWLTFQHGNHTVRRTGEHSMAKLNDETHVLMDELLPNSWTDFWLS
jgi:hypothetical protein